MRYDYFYDGRGNVGSILRASDQVEMAAYRYDGFGSVTSKYIAAGFTEQAYRFSTKYTYANYGLVYYGKRFYLLPVMKWLTRDPSGERGGLNLYLTLNNSFLNFKDILGMSPGQYFHTFNEVALDATRHAYNLLILESTIDYNGHIHNREYNWNYYTKDGCYTYDEPAPGPEYIPGQILPSSPPWQNPLLGAWYAYGHIHGWSEPDLNLEMPSELFDYPANTRGIVNGLASMVPTQTKTDKRTHIPGTIGTPSGAIIIYYYNSSGWTYDSMGNSRWY